MARVNKLRKIFLRVEKHMIVSMSANKNDLVERGKMMAVEKRQNYWSNVWESLKERDIVLKQGSAEFMWECGLSNRREGRTYRCR